MQSRFIKEVHVLMRNLDKYTESQAQFAHLDHSDLRNIQVDLTPKRGPYRGGKFRFGIRIPKAYPFSPPEVVCLSEIYHPNIETDVTDDHNICLNLFDEWTPSFGLLDVINGLLYLLENPNLDDYISSLFAGSESNELFFEDVKRSMRGEKFAVGYQFVANDSFLAYERSLVDVNVTESIPQGEQPVETAADVKASEDSSKPETNNHESVNGESVTQPAEARNSRPASRQESPAELCEHVEILGIRASSEFEALKNAAISRTELDAASATSDDEEDEGSDSETELAKAADGEDGEEKELSEGEIEALLDARAAGCVGECVLPGFDTSERVRERFERRQQLFGSGSSTLVDDAALLDFLDEYDTETEEARSEASDLFSVSEAAAPQQHTVAGSRELLRNAARMVCDACRSLTDEQVRSEALHGHLFAGDFKLICSAVCVLGALCFARRSVRSSADRPHPTAPPVQFQSDSEFDDSSSESPDEPRLVSIRQLSDTDSTRC